MPRPILRPMTIRALAAFALALPHVAAAQVIAPLSPPRQFDSLAVPMAPVQPSAPVRVPPPEPPVVPAPAWGKDTPAPSPPLRIQPQTPPPAGEDADLIERGAGILLENLLTEMQPTFEQMARGLDGAATKFGPALNDLGALVDDIGNYQTPERLANGDILIRRKADAPPPPASNALRDLATPDAAPAPGAAPPASGAPPAEPPPLAAPIPSLPSGTQIDL